MIGRSQKFNLLKTRKIKNQQMSFFTRCFSKKSPPTSLVNSPMEQHDSEARRVKEERKKAEDRERAYNELHFSSGMDLPIHPKPIHPSHVLDKKLVVGQFGEPQRAQKIAETMNST